ncbi:hypothetical protein C8R45DRAFT_948130 [Mycena sanguinolenta]|nr:hypothetical protein C8R45DRAFT_948130 [Mycena sanguinolenta]
MSFNLGGINGSVTISTTLSPATSSLGGFNLGGVNGSVTVGHVLPTSTASGLSSVGSSLASFNLGGINASEPTSTSTSASQSGSTSTSASLTSPAPSNSATAPPHSSGSRMSAKRRGWLRYSQIVWRIPVPSAARSLSNSEPRKSGSATTMSTMGGNIAGEKTSLRDLFKRDAAFGYQKPSNSNPDIIVYGFHEFAGLSIHNANFANQFYGSTEDLDGRKRCAHLIHSGDGTVEEQSIEVTVHRTESDVFGVPKWLVPAPNGFFGGRGKVPLCRSPSLQNTPPKDV